MELRLDFLVPNALGTLFSSRTFLVGLEFDTETVTWESNFFSITLVVEMVRHLDPDAGGLDLYFLPNQKVIDDLLLSLHGPESQCSLELHIYYLLYSAPLLPELVIFPVNHVQWKQNKLVIWGQGSLFYSRFRVFW